MKKKLFYLFLLVMTLISATPTEAAVTITSSNGWFESAYVEWTKEAGYSYNVYVSPAASNSWTKLDTELVREYSTYGRADALGLVAGNYKMKVVPVQGGTEITADAAETGSLAVIAHDRGGFAHFKTASSTFNPANGIGAYKNDGTLKDGAKVIYVTADNAKSITTDVVTNDKGGTTTGMGFQNIINLYQKGYDKTPITFRIIGTIKAADMDGFGSSAEGVQIKGKGSYSEMNITIEGVGFDATVHGFGFLLRNTCSIEFRNFAIMWCMDDAVSMDTDNSNLWIHNLDLFYGKPGGAADQKKGDGTLDIKGDSKYCTMSYNHLWDSGKSSLCGMTSESGPNYITYHHNWFDHSDSRHPRIRTMSVHIYNNYFDGNAKYGVGAAESSDAFVENNYFRNCKYPMLSSKQGSDVNNGQGSAAETKGTFSGENGGIIKAIGNVIEGAKKYQKWTESGINNTHFDAYEVASKSDKVPSTVKALQGGHVYNNFDTDASLMYTGYTCHAGNEVKDVVTGEYGAGRCKHDGNKVDFSWTFGANEDTNYEVISALSTAIQNYKSTLVGFFGKTISNGGGSESDNTGGSNEGNGGSGDDNTGDDSGEDNNYVEETFISGELNNVALEEKTMDDYFFFCPENETKANELIADGTITLVDGKVAGSEASTFNKDYTYDAAANGKTFSSTVYTGALQLAKASAAKAKDGGSVIFKCPKGVTTFATYLYRTGSVYLNLYTSTDGKTWKLVTSVDKSPSGIFEKNFSSSVADTEHCVFIKLENTSTGSLNIQGVRILNVEGAEAKEPTEGGDTGGDTGGETGGETGGDEVTGKIYSWNDNIGTTTASGATEETVKIHNNKDAVKAYKFAANANYIEIKPVSGGFKAGDIVYIAGAYNNKAEKQMTLVITTSATSNKTDVVYTTPSLVNGQTSANDPTLESYTLTADCATLYIWRGVGSTTFLTTVYVVRPDVENGIYEINTDVKSKNSTMYDLQGRRIASPLKGQIYIMNGKKYIGK